jgi:riboflavin kinase/FMN adenylyltransferase
VNRPVKALALADLPPIGPAVVTLGVFDGVHLGHGAVLDATRSAAAERGAKSLALVFDPHPDEVLRPGSRVPRLAPAAVNRSRIVEFGIDHALAIRFDAELRSLTAEAFLAALSPAIDLRALVMSTQSAFGRDRGGTVERMRGLGGSRRFDVVTVDPVQIEGGSVSSTRIRDAIAAGDLATARRLGVPPYLEGTVVAGDGRGHSLGFPTANLRFGYEPAMPSLGVYAGRVAHGGPPGQQALVSIGTRPTFQERGEVVVEVHLLDYSGDLYGALLGVELVARLRDERRFTEVAALVEQMHRDAEAARAVLGNG